MFPLSREEIKNISWEKTMKNIFKELYSDYFLHLNLHTTFKSVRLPSPNLSDS